MTSQLYYFTGTGNGLHVAKSIKASLSNKGQKVELIPINTLNLDKTITTHATTVGIIYPTYAMAAPEIVRKFARVIKVQKNSYLFTYAHCGGGGASGAIAEVSDILTSRGLRVTNTFVTTFPSNSTLFKYTDDKLKAVLKKADSSIKKNILEIVDQKENVWKASGLFKKAGQKVNGLFSNALEGYMQFNVIKADNKCIACGVCSKVCPVANIEMQGQPVFKDHCEMCLSCVNNCPKQALAFKKMNKETFNPYKHPEISLKELMYR